MRLHLHNVGPIRDADIDFTPLTVLVGPNGSGKTTFTTITYAAIQAHRVAVIDALDQLESLDSEGERRKRGPRMAKLIVGEWERSFTKRFDFELRRCCAPDLMSLARARRGGRDAAPRIEVGTEHWALVFRIGDDLWLEREHRCYRRPRLELKSGTSLGAARARIRNSLGTAMPRRGVYFPAGRSALVQTHSAMTALMVGALSGGYFEDATIGEIPGTIADFMQMMARMQARRGSGVKVTPAVARRLEKELLHGTVRLREKGGRKNYVFLPQGQDEERPLESAATSVSELSPLILYLRHWALGRDSILIDEPESHLHPEAQVPLAAVLMDLAGSIAPVVIATHSDFLVSALSNELLHRSRAKSAAAAAEQLAVHEFRFHDKDRGLGVDVAQVKVESTEGFEIERFSEVADEVFTEGITAYNKLHVDE